jgi:hypothetical protein
MLLRGKDALGYSLPEKLPKADLDPDCLAELDRVFTLYKMALQRLNYLPEGGAWIM